MMKAWKNIPLYMKIFILLIAGCVIGFVFGENVAVLAPVGDAYIKLLKMLIVPLVFFSIISGVTKLASPKEFGQVRHTCDCILHCDYHRGCSYRRGNLPGREPWHRSGGNAGYRGGDHLPGV